jgi:hypothetical protein
MFSIGTSSSLVQCKIYFTIHFVPYIIQENPPFDQRGTAKISVYFPQKIKGKGLAFCLCKKDKISLFSLPAEHPLDRRKFFWYNQGEKGGFGRKTGIYIHIV